jgi:hypothetical protein
MNPNIGITFLENVEKKNNSEPEGDLEKQKLNLYRIILLLNACLRSCLIGEG